MIRISSYPTHFLVGLCCCWFVADSNAQTAELKQETIVTGLRNPSGVAIQPETGHVFVADSGNLKIVRIVDGKAQDVIIEFAKDEYGDNPKFEIGPLSLAFFDKTTLVVGGGGNVNGEEKVFTFTVPEVGAEAIKADAATSTVTLAAEGEVPAEENFMGLSVQGDQVLVACNGDDTKGWLAKASVKENKLADFQRFVATFDSVQTKTPTSVVLSPEGFIAVSSMGEIGEQTDSTLSFFDSAGKFRDQFRLQLSDVTAIAYSTKRQRLFAADVNWNHPDQGGIFKIVKAPQPDRCQAVKVVQLTRPTALAFDAEGNLYVTVVGSPTEAEPNAGSLIKISGIDVAPKSDQAQVPSSQAPSSQAATPPGQTPK